MSSYADALYSVKRGFLILGLTGYTGSGCTTVSKLLKKSTKLQFPEHIETENENQTRRMKLVWEKYKWNKFIQIEVAKVIFLIMAQCALKSQKDNEIIRAIKEIFLNDASKINGLNIDSGAIKIDQETAERIIIAYETSCKFYQKFKRKLGFKVWEFIKLMQNSGDDIRKYGSLIYNEGINSNPNNIFVLPETVRRILKAYRVAKNKKYFVIDAFRNPYEVEFFKRRYNEFYLISIQRDEKERCTALSELKKDEQLELKNREQGKKVADRTNNNAEDWVTSQNIKECSFKADIFINNKNDTTKRWPHLIYNIIKILSLAANPGYIKPSNDERCMQIAMAARQCSGCLSRQVGAVVSNDKGFILGVGWNDPPEGQTPCAYRRIKDLFIAPETGMFSSYELSDIFKNAIKKKYGANDSNPFCFADELKNIRGKKQAEFTRALHAEENAFFQALTHGTTAIANGTLYTTDSPCNLCAKKAYHLGINRVVYIDDYPDIAIDQTLFSGSKKIGIDKFEGITGSAYYRLFCSLMPEKDFLSLYK